MDISLNYRWAAAESSPGVPYHFPQRISPHFRANCDGPAIYRWVVFKQVADDLRRIYIGEAELLSRRVNGYLKPGPSQLTNQRLKAEFEEELNTGHKVALEVLSFDSFKIDAILLSMTDLNNKTVRRFLEGLFAVYYSRLGYTVLNL